MTWSWMDFKASGCEPNVGFRVLGFRGALIIGMGFMEVPYCIIILYIHKPYSILRPVYHGLGRLVCELPGPRYVTPFAL